jgi:hypothetical protein
MIIIILWLIELSIVDSEVFGSDRFIRFRGVVIAPVAFECLLHGFLGIVGFNGAEK